MTPRVASMTSRHRCFFASDQSANHIAKPFIDITCLQITSGPERNALRAPDDLARRRLVLDEDALEKGARERL